MKKAETIVERVSPVAGKGRKRRWDNVLEEEDQYLEQTMVKKYVELQRTTQQQRKHYLSVPRNCDISLIMYRMYLLSHDRNDRMGLDNCHTLRSRQVAKPKQQAVLPSPLEISRFWGKIDFGFETDKRYILSSARRIWETALRRTDLYETIYCDNIVLVSAPHCELVRPKHSAEFVWIKDLRSVHGTFVNGKKIPPDTKYKLLDGDIVSLGMSHDPKDIKINVRSRNYYVFKIKSVNEKMTAQETPDADDEFDINNPVEFALSNVLIIDNILSCLRLSDLKKCRFFNQLWKSRADREMVSHSQLKFEFRYHSRHMPLSILEVEWSELFQEKISMMKRYNFDTYEIDIAHPIGSPLRGPPRQFYSDTAWLLENMGSFMKDLILSMTIVEDKKGTHFNKVLSKLINIEKIDLSLDINTGLYPILGSYPLSLPNLKYLTVWIHDVEGDDELRDPLKNHIVSELEKLFPNLQGVTARTGMIQNFLHFLINNRDKWTRLTAFAGEFELYGDTENPTLTFNTLTCLSQNLTKLQLDDIPALNLLGVAAFEAMLKKLSTTLQFLSLKFAETGDDDAESTIIIPSFPHLTFLQLIIYVEDTDLRLTLRFPGGTISYEKDFPLLKVLSLLPSDTQDDDSHDGIVSNVRDIFLTFLPETPTVSRTMRWVEFCLEKEWSQKDNQYFPWFKNFLNQFQKTFPNVLHPEIIQGVQTIKAIEAQEIKKVADIVQEEVD